MSFATTADLSAPGRFPRPLTSKELEQAPTMLADASFWLSVWVPGLAAAVDGGDPIITEAAMLQTVEMVKRALLAQAAQQNPGPSAEQVSESWGPYGQSVRYRTDSGNLYMYDRELQTLLGLLGGSMAKAVSMRSRGL